MPRIIFGRPENTAGQDFLTWWHVPIEIRPRCFQWKSIDDCSISVYIHSGGIGTIEKGGQSMLADWERPSKIGYDREKQKILGASQLEIDSLESICR